MKRLAAAMARVIPLSRLLTLGSTALGPLWLDADAVEAGAEAGGVAVREPGRA